jgi:hypothetical protein
MFCQQVAMSSQQVEKCQEAKLDDKHLQETQRWQAASCRQAAMSN